ncbi:hypothetical protein PHLCEN_2v8412 [Hermanssonia centrifuga]|uniref:Peptidase C14 caspase domain-containing protein n=1 Tax=Hermanssonia centrifuga TaxID=98765 RepID=A0A2R6NUE4_9APHY|nr:hypothetical protein PHLCEN_2v8412 [Hermanssonia centrifuga]
MASRVFALIIGIDKYKSGNIWNLESCVDDAQSIRHLLMHDLHVPQEQICFLTDQQATKRAIEDAFMSHLVNNPDIERGDAMVLYFAGHGASIRSPKGWFTENGKDVEVLCPYDYDSKSSEGRVSGISDRSFQAMLRDLSESKGNNVTVILDCCFSSPASSRDRRHTRWTPTSKATPDDLYIGLWRNALARSNPTDVIRGFTRASGDSHIVLAASRQGGTAVEGKGGGLFTQALISVKDSVPLHTLTFVDLLHLIEKRMEGYRPVVVGQNIEQTLFDGVPFTADPCFVSVDAYDSDQVRIDAGAIHGVVEGTEFSIHDHNYRSSLNPLRGTVYASEIHPTWCLARTRSQSKKAIPEGWARIRRWNNRAPFRVHLRRSLFSILRRCRLSSALPLQPTLSRAQSREGVNIVRVKHSSQADMSLTLRRNEMTIERHDAMLAANCRRIIHLPSSDSQKDLKVIDAAARFHLHLHRKNPWKPMLGLVAMELYRVDVTTWTKVSGNLLVDGRAQIVDDKNSVYSVVLHNYSDRDLWPYLVGMDSGGYSISMVYHPDAATSEPPLKKHSSMVIGSGTLGSEALAFTLGEGADAGAGFLKLFVSSVFTPMTFIEQGVANSTAFPKTRPSEKAKEVGANTSEIWDSVVACVTIVRNLGVTG